MKRTAGFMLCVAMVAGMGYGQGALNPSGAPATSMKTLAQVEPRIAIAGVKYITQPGSYYLTTNVSSISHGVVIQCDDVTLDLNGYTLSGDNDVVDYGIYLDAIPAQPLRNVVVKNGMVRNFGRGVRVQYGHNCRFENLVLSSNNINGMEFYGFFGTCQGNAVRSCILNDNGSHGLYLYGTSGRCSGNSVESCIVYSNRMRGIYLNGYAGAVDGNSFVACLIHDNGLDGMLLDGNQGSCSGNMIRDCTISGNSQHGITLVDTNSGSCAGNSIVGCTLRGNWDHEIFLKSASENRIENNHMSTGVSGNTYGIETSGSTNNAIFKNTSIGHRFNFMLSGQDVYGPIVTNAGALPSTGDAAQPWANFSR